MKNEKVVLNLQSLNPIRIRRCVNGVNKREIDGKVQTFGYVRYMDENVLVKKIENTRSWLGTYY